MPAKKRGRVLVVDDEMGMREILQVLLSRTGYSVDLESSGRKGITRIEKENPYDLVLTDLVMPGADGMEVLLCAKKKCEDTQF